MSVNELVGKTPQQIDGITPGVTDISARSYIDTYIMQRLIDLANRGLGAGANVDDYGAVGDGLTDDTAAITSAINAVGSGGVVFFPKGEYYVTSGLPFYNQMSWIGEGQSKSTFVQFVVTKMLYANVAGDNRQYDVYLSTSSSLKEFLAGDPIELKNMSRTENNAKFEIKSVDDTNKVIRILHSAATGTGNQAEDPAPGGAIAELDIFRGGSVLRMRSLVGNTGSGRFIDATDIQSAVIKNMAFIGPGLEGSGGGIRFQRNTDNRALTNYYFDNISCTYIGAQNAIHIEQPVSSTFSNFRITRCTDDALVFDKVNVGGSMTSCEISNIYNQSVRRGIYIKSGVYFNINTCVFEGCSIGFHFENCSGFTLNSPASETIKYKKQGGGNGVTILLDKCYSFVINAPTIFYNTETSGWAKAAILALHTPRFRPAGIINGGRYHRSIAEMRDVLGHSWTSFAAYLYIDEPLATLTADFWKVGRQLLGVGFTSDVELNERHQIISVASESIGTTTYVKTVDPTVNNDSSQGYAVGETWWNIINNKKFRVFDVSVGAAIWREDISYSIVKVDARLTRFTSIISDTGAKAVKIGRNFGADVVTKNVYRIWETEQVGSTSLDLWLDVADRIPTGYQHAITFGSPDESFSGSYKLEAHDTEVVSSVTYYRIRFNAASLVGSGFSWTGGGVTVAAPTGTKVTSDYLSFSETFTASYINFDEANKKIYFLFPASEFITNGNDIEVFGTMDKRMEGTYPVNSIAVEDTQVKGSRNIAFMPSIKVNVTTPSNTILDREEDWGFYAHEGLDYGIESQLTLCGGNEAIVYDEQNAIGRMCCRSGSVAIADTVASVTVKLKDPQDYDFAVSITQNAKVWVSSFTTTDFTITRSSSTGNETIFWQAFRKVNLGYGYRRKEFFVT